jgi:hypothetical protein
MAVEGAAQLRFAQQLVLDTLAELRGDDPPAEA